MTLACRRRSTPRRRTAPAHGRRRRRSAVTPAPTKLRAPRRWRAGKRESCSSATRADYPQGPARPAAEHVPGVRLAARRPADAADRDGAVGLGLLRLRADLTSHFYGARRVGRLRAVQLRDAGHRQAVRGHPRGGAQARRPGALRRDRRHQPLRADRLRRAAAAAAEEDRRRADHRHRRAGLRRADPCRGQGRAGRRDARLCPRRGRGRARCRRPRGGASDRPTVTLLGEMFPADPIGIGVLLEPLGLAAGPVVPTPRVARALRRARLRARSRRSIRSTPRRSASSRRPGDRSSAPRRSATTAPRPGSKAIGDAFGVAAREGRRRRRTRSSPRSRRARRHARSAARITLSGYEGSELLVARLLIESGADVPYVGTACPRTPWSEADRDWLEAHGARVAVPRLLEQDLAAMEASSARPRHRHDAGGAEGQGSRRSRRSTSPT